MTTLTVDAHREQMLALLNAGRPYDFLNMAVAYLKVCADDDFVRLMTVREYLALNLTVPARELLESRLADGCGSNELDALRKSVSKLSGSPIPWSRYAERFEENLAALSQRDEDAARIRQAWLRHSDDFQLFVDRNRAHHVRHRGDQGIGHWIPFLADHRALDDGRPLPDDIKGSTPGPYLFEGLGQGRFFERVYEATRDTFIGYSCPLYVVEPDAAALAVVLHLNDWRTILADPRVIFFVGADCLDRLRRCWDADLDLPWPQHAFTLGTFPADYKPGAVAVVREAGLAREHAVRESLADLEQRYAARDVRYWAARFADVLNGRPGAPGLRILAAVSIHTTFLQHSMRDARRALESLGHQVRVLSEDRPYTIIGPLTYHNAIRGFDPDLFFILDHLRPECETLVPQNLPILTWDQDQLPQVFTKTNLQRIARHDFIAGCSKFHCVSLGCDSRQFLNARVPTCPEQFSGEPPSDEELRRYACDVSFVSHASQTPKAFHEHERASYGNPAIARLLDAMYELLPDQLARYRVVDGGVMSVVLGEACRRCGVANLDPDLRSRLCGWYLWRLGDRMFRHEALEWVAAWAGRNGRSFRIYGNGWDKHPTLSAFAAGPAGNGRELLCVYRASRINLQLMPAGFVHQRSLDGLTAGGFFLGRYVPDDLRGGTLRRLTARIDELGVGNTRALLDHRDPELQQLLRDYVGERLDRGDHFPYDLLTHIRVNAELTYPDEAFSDMPEIVFDSAEQFAALADRFLGDESARRAITERMRSAVIARFSYRATMDRFLHAMAGHLRAAARS
ncbi:MAG: glycosyltransferase [Phycisphaerales bacterium]|nr:glycosyltransferase [Phycisphaerales bacterium]